MKLTANSYDMGRPFLYYGKKIWEVSMMDDVATFWIICFYLGIICSVLFQVVTPLATEVEFWTVKLEERFHLHWECSLAEWAGSFIFLLWIAFDVWLFRVMMP